MLQKVYKIFHLEFLCVLLVAYINANTIYYSLHYYLKLIYFKGSPKFGNLNGTYIIYRI